MTDRDDRPGHGSRLARGGQVHITVAREEGGKPFALTVPDWLFKVALGLAGLLAVLIVGGGMLTARMGTELRRLHEIEEENAVLRAENRKVEALAQELAELDALREQILALAGAGKGSARGHDDKAGTRGMGQEKAVAAEGRGAAKSGGAAKPGGAAESRIAAGLRRSVPAVPVPLLPPSMRKGGIKTGDAPPLMAPAVPGTQAHAQAFPARWPVDGVISKAFQINVTPEREHHGIDIAAPHGTAVHAAGSGVVAFAEMDSVFGLLVVINHGGGWQTVYGHNSRLVVGIGDSVRVGQEIAQVGSTGESSAPHLHFEVRRGGRPVDPSRYLGR